MSGSRPPCLQAAEADLLRISNKVRFILAVVDGRLKLSKRRKADIEAELEAEGYDKLPSQKKAQQLVRVAGKGKAAARRTAADMAGGMGTMGCIVLCGMPVKVSVEPYSCIAASPSLPQAAASDEEEGEVAGASYEYLLSMPLASLTMEKVEALKKVRVSGRLERLWRLQTPRFHGHGREQLMSGGRPWQVQGLAWQPAHPLLLLRRRAGMALPGWHGLRRRQRTGRRPWSGCVPSPRRTCGATTWTPLSRWAWRCCVLQGRWTARARLSMHPTLGLP